MFLNSKRMLEVLRQQLAKGIADVALIQEPTIYRGQMSGLTSSGEKIFLLNPMVTYGPVFMSGTILMSYRCCSYVLGM
jgi:hypothetical protein